MRSFRAKPTGWRGESHRHYLAAKGISTRYNVTKFKGPRSIPMYTAKKYVIIQEGGHLDESGDYEMDLSPISEFNSKSEAKKALKKMGYEGSPGEDVYIEEVEETDRGEFRVVQK